jgi:hypothetical protein
MCTFTLDILITICLDIGDSDTQESDVGAPTTSKRRKTTSFFNCLRTKSPAPSSELDAFLADPSTDPTCVLKYPTVTGIYRRRNTSLPASAAVERVFSVGGQIHKPTRSRLSDEMFDKLLFLKINSKFES